MLARMPRAAAMGTLVHRTCVRKRIVVLAAVLGAAMLAGAIGKAPGHVLRLALVLEFLLWCGDETAPEPDCISADAVRAAALA